MSTKRGRGPEDVPPPGADDFERIHGIDARTKQRLYSAKIHTFADLATLTPNEIAMKVRLSGITAELIRDQDWIDQARELASTLQAEPQNDTSSSAEPQDDAMNPEFRPAVWFTVKLVPDKDNKVHSTYIEY